MPDKEERILNKPEVFVKSITFNDGTIIEFNKSDIVIFTGANNVGKSQLLKDILEYFKTDNHYFVKIITNLEGEFLGDIEYLLKNAKRDYKGHYRIGMNYYSEDLIKSWWKRKILEKDLHSIFINFLETIKRLESSKTQNSFDSLKDEPKHPVQYLLNDDKKEDEISSYFYQAFGENLILDKGAGSTIPVFVGKKPKINREIEDRVSTSYRKRLSLLPTLERQGDGMRSFASVLLDIFTTQYPITLIDEPEAFLHPPQARLLGKMLANNISVTRQLFIATHSEDFLKGLLDANNENVKIIRIDRIENINKIYLLKNEDIKQFWKDPILRYSNILSGLFHSKVVFCESDSDCRFYQAMINVLHGEEQNISPDILFTHCGGKQRFKTVISALRLLNVRIVAICDIDTLNEKTIFKEIVESLGIDWTVLESDWNIIDDYVRHQRSQLNKDDVIEKIKIILENIDQSETVFPQSSAEELSKIVKKASAWSKVKEIGKSYFSGASYTSFEKVDRVCRNNGLFIVPVGELESFYKPVSDHGPKWVNKVLETTDLRSDSNLHEARDFVSTIVRY